MIRVRPVMLMIMGAMALSACTNTVGCSGLNPPPPQWLSYRNNPGRLGEQFLDTAMSNPTTVLASLHVLWQSPGTTWPGAQPGPFTASPIVFNNTIYIGDTNGVFWAINANDGTFRWRYPATGALNGSCTQGNWGSYGIPSSATYASINSTDAVIFGAPDPDQTVDGGNGSARLWALNAASGALIWKSAVVGHVNPCSSASGSLHERIGHSSPLVFAGRVYVGIHDAADNPVQKGKIVAVDLNSGNLSTGFPFVVDGAPLDPTCGGVCGGGVWNAPATDGRSILFTTGNVCDSNTYNTAECETEPSPDYSLSMVSIDPTSGARNWSFRAVPFKLDADPDWAAGPTTMITSCGELVASVQKDGWTYALNPADGSCKWQFPPTSGPGCTFAATDTHVHGDDHYYAPGATWGDYLFIQTGGEALTDPGGVSKGYGRLHALDACQPDSNRVRWIADIDPGVALSIGAPVVTGGMVYVTTSAGHVVAFADPSVAPPVGYRCSSVDFGPPSPTWMSDCTSAGFQIVPVPASIDVALGDGGNAAGLRMEAAIALDQLYVATSLGHVYALGP